MKKFGLLTLVILISTLGCRKNASVTEQTNQKVETYATQLINDESFAFSVNNIVNNTRSIFKIIQKKGGKKLLKNYMKLAKTNPSYNQLKGFYIANNIDTAKMLQLHSENLASVLFILDQNPSFAEENPEIQSKVLSHISSTMNRMNFDSRYKNSPIIAYAKNDKEKVGSAENNFTRMNDPEEQPDDPDDPITEDLGWESVAKCAVETIGGAIAGSTSLFKSLYNVITGYNLGFSGIVRVATSAFKTFMGSNAAGMAITFGTCLIVEAIWGDNEPPDDDTTIYPILDTINFPVPDTLNVDN